MRWDATWLFTHFTGWGSDPLGSPPNVSARRQPFPHRSVRGSFSCCSVRPSNCRFLLLVALSSPLDTTSTFSILKSFSDRVPRFSFLTASMLSHDLKHLCCLMLNYVEPCWIMLNVELGYLCVFSHNQTVQPLQKLVFVAVLEIELRVFASRLPQCSATN